MKWKILLGFAIVAIIVMITLAMTKPDRPAHYDAVKGYIPEKQEPELMYKLFNKVCCSIDELIDALK